MIETDPVVAGGDPGDCRRPAFKKSIRLIKPESLGIIGLETCNHSVMEVRNQYATGRRLSERRRGSMVRKEAGDNVLSQHKKVGTARSVRSCRETSEVEVMLHAMRPGADQ